jgi:hypothetical protein
VLIRLEPLELAIVSLRDVVPLDDRSAVEARSLLRPANHDARGVGVIAVEEAAALTAAGVL